MSLIKEPRIVAEEIDSFAASNKKACALSMTIELPLTDYFAKWRGIEQPRKVARPQIVEVKSWKSWLVH